jgi:hypothetical protein
MEDNIFTSLFRIGKSKHNPAPAGNQKDIVRQAYQIGYKGLRFPSFTTIGEDSRQCDIERAVRVFVIDRNHEATAEVIDIATRIFAPLLKSYINGLKDGCRERGNNHLLDMGRELERRIASQGERLKEAAEPN